MTPTRNLINGLWVDSAGGGRMAVLDPGTHELLADVPSSVAADYRAAVDAASTAFPLWSGLSATDRSTYLRRLFDLVVADTPKLAQLISQESGKPLVESKGECAYAAGFLEWAAEEAKRVYGETIPSSDVNRRILVQRQPVGVTAAITPWNFPLAMLTRKLGPALAAGCTQVLKPADATPLTALRLGELSLEAGIPDGVMNVVTGPGPVAGEALLGDQRVRKLSFTGSTAVGQELVRRSAAHVTRLSLELGGHAPVLVLEDADVDLAVAASVQAKFRNSGQACIAANRFYIASNIFEEFAAALVIAVRKLEIGHWRTGAHIGPLINPEAMARVARHVDNAVAMGATVLCGGRPADMDAVGHRYYMPTVLAGVTSDMLVAREETFGPVAALSAFSSLDDVIAEANASPFGLAAYVFARDVGQIVRTVERLSFGVIGVNDGAPSTPQAPFGGMRLSGYGREGGRHVMHEYLETKYVSLVL